MTSPAAYITSFVQTAYLVGDVHAAARSWAKTFNAGPFFVLEGIEPVNLGGSDAPTSLAHSSAYGQLGGEMIELVQPNNGATSVFDWPLGKLHHRAAFAHDLGKAIAAFEAHDMALRASAQVNETPFVFIDALAELGHFVELYPSSESLNGFYAMVADAAKDWDGDDPVRLIG